MRACAFLLSLFVGGCYYELGPIALSDDLGVPDLLVDLTGVQVDGPTCPNGRAPLHSGELTEPPITSWGAEPLAPVNVSDPTATVVLDTGRFSTGVGSLRLDTNNGQAGVFYPSTRDARYDLTPYLYVSFAVTADDSAAANDPGWQGASPHLLLVTTANDYFEYIPADNRLPRSPGAFAPITVPLAGGNGWTRNTTGSPDLSKVAYLALTFDSWGAGFTVWIDDLQIGSGTFLDCQ